MTMSGPLVSSSTLGGKAVNAGASSPLHPPQNSPSFDSSRRSESSKRSGVAATATSAPRNIQGRKKQHKNTRRARLEDEDEMAESTAVRNPNSRRGQTSITHLMNFSLPPRPQNLRNQPNQHAYGQSSRRFNNVYGIGSGRHSIDKARYVHANYRFIVRPDGDYKQLAVNADHHLQWEDVLQVLASAQSQDASCPICLSHPVAPRMAKCGHIFCLPCLIRYMHSTAEASPFPERKPRWKKCPICWDSVYISETRPVRWFTGQEAPAPNEGDDIVLRLIMRQPGSTLALPRDGADALASVDDIPWYFAAEVTDYARIMKGSEQYLMEQYDQEIHDLQRQENEDELMFGEEPEWTRKAVKAVNDAKEKVIGIGKPPVTPAQPAEKTSRRQRAAEGFTAPGDPNVAPHEAQVGSNPSTLTSPRPQQHHHSSSPYYFYQALLHYYLAPLDIRILKAAFGEFSLFPATILPRVERVSTGHIVDDELRRRTKYLAHLPYGCEVGFLECNWTDVVEPKVLEEFKEDIEKRRKRNRDKEYREEKDRQRAEKAEDDARWAAVRRRRPSSPTMDHFHSSPIDVLDAADASPPWPRQQGASFASLASPSTSPSATRTVWGTAAIAPSSPELKGIQAEPDTDDGWLPHWEEHMQDEDEALAAQLLAASLDEGGPSTAVSMVNGGGGSGGKKKKAKKITLMSTTARRAA